MEQNNVIETVGSFKITEKDYAAYVKRLGPDQQRHASNPEFRKQVIEQLVSMALFAEEAKTQKIDETEAFIEDLEAAKKEILAQHMMMKVLSALNVTEEEMKQFYELNKKSFQKPETVGAKHILVDDEETCSQIKSAIDAGEKTFEDAAKECSTCPSKERGGDLGVFGHGQMVKEFDEAAFAAKEGEIVGPVKTQFGYHLIQVYQKNEPQTAAFEEVASAIKTNLMKKKQGEIYTVTLDELQKKYMK